MTSFNPGDRVTDGKRICSFDGCDRKHYGRGYCRGHWEQWHRGNPLKPLAGRAIPVMERFFQKVEKTENCWNWTGFVNVRYGRMRVNGIKIYAHRFSYEKFVGPIPSGMEVDHICLNYICVNPDHLRLVTRKQNMEHQSDRPEGRYSSKYRGVSFKKSCGKWSAYVGHNGKHYNLGVFDTEDQAAEVARNKRLELFTHNEIDKAYAHKVAREVAK